MMKKLILFALLMLCASGRTWGADVTIGQNSTVRNTVIASGDNLVISATGITLDNATIAGTCAISQAVTARNVTFYGDVTLDNGITLTATYCDFLQSEAAVETAGGTVGTKTGCKFSTDPKLVNPTGSRDIDYMIKPDSPCRGAGTNLSATFTTGLSPRGGGLTDERGEIWDIGAFVYVPSRWELLWDRMFGRGRWSRMTN